MFVADGRHARFAKVDLLDVAAQNHAHGVLKELKTVAIMMIAKIAF